VLLMRNDFGKDAGWSTQQHRGDRKPHRITHVGRRH
jgi:hypothetical protein